MSQENIEVVRAAFEAWNAGDTPRPSSWRRPTPSARLAITRWRRLCNAKLGKNSSHAQVVAVVKTTTVPSIQAHIDGIRAVGAPSGDQATVTNLLNLA